MHYSTARNDVAVLKGFAITRKRDGTRGKKRNRLTWLWCRRRANRWPYFLYHPTCGEKRIRPYIEERRGGVRAHLVEREDVVVDWTVQQVGVFDASVGDRLLSRFHLLRSQFLRNQQFPSLQLGNQTPNNNSPYLCLCPTISAWLVSNPRRANRRDARCRQIES